MPKLLLTTVKDAGALVAPAICHRRRRRAHRRRRGQDGVDLCGADVQRDGLPVWRPKRPGSEQSHHPGSSGAEKTRGAGSKPDPWLCHRSRTSTPGRCLSSAIPPAPNWRIDNAIRGNRRLGAGHHRKDHPRQANPLYHATPYLPRNLSTLQITPVSTCSDSFSAFLGGVQNLLNRNSGAAADAGTISATSLHSRRPPAIRPQRKHAATA